MDNGITYKEEIKIKVYLDKRLIGTIKKVDGGWQYFPNGKKEGGSVYQMLEGCKRSLEGPEK